MINISTSRTFPQIETVFVMKKKKNKRTKQSLINAKCDKKRNKNDNNVMLHPIKGLLFP